MTITIDQICVYPVKGLSAQALDQVELEPGDGMPGDRRFGLAHAASSVDLDRPGWVHRRNFLVRAHDEKIAQLQASYDAATGKLTLKRNGRQVSAGNLSTPIGRSLIEQFLAAFMPAGPRGNPKIVETVTGESFTDNPENHLSIINLASVKDIERILRQPVAPARFRGNLYIAGAAPWQENGWVGQEIRIGAVRGLITERIERCRATCVNPDTGEVDMNVPLALRQGFGHVDCGVFFRVLEGGGLHQGDALDVPDPA